MRTSAERRESLLAEFDRSGLSGKKFSELSGVKYQTFATWLQKRRRAGQPAAKPEDTVRWLEAVVERAQTPGAKSPLVLVVKLPGNASLEVSDLKQVLLAAALLPEHGPVGRASSDGASDGVTRLHEIMAKERTALDGTLPTIKP